ncbi:MAG TPA: hypothetical protein VFX37_04445 [Pseudolabrys sp.]|nr:hypothetical protein [Pseudolabrys sp.]
MKSHKTGQPAGFNHLCDAASRCLFAGYARQRMPNQGVGALPIILASVSQITVTRPGQE